MAAAICMYELKQKLIHSGIDYKLNKAKKLDLKIKWAINSIKSGKEIYEQFVGKV